MHRVYMDANATTPLSPEVFAAMRPWMLETFGNASSVHYHGQHARAAVEHARESVAKLLNCRGSEIVFTSGGTEGDNLAIFGLIEPGDHLITSTIEHHAVLHAAQCLAKRGVDVTFLPVNSDCLIDPEDVRPAIRPNTKLISIMMANNETGVIQPVDEIGRIAAEADVYFHTDAVQAAGKIAIDVTKIGCDLLTIAGHKMYAPQGVGALYVSRGTKIEPLFFGGTHERQRRAGTENVAGIVGLGKAAELALAACTNLGAPFKPSVGLSGMATNSEPSVGSSRTETLRDRLETGLLNRLENIGINAANPPRVPNTTNIWFDNLDGESLAIALDLRGLAVSGGSACASGAAEPSHVLTAMGLTPARGRASLRFSLTKYTTAEDIDFALEVVTAAVGRLREIAPAFATLR
jgi:cysteine desulfurase